MMPGDILRMALRSVRNRGLRSGLTVLGTVIGVAAVVALVALGTGFSQAINSQLGGLGGQSISVTPGFNRAATRFQNGPGETVAPGSNVGNLTEADERVVRGVPGVASVDGIVSARAVVTVRGEGANLVVQGVEPAAWQAMDTTGIALGRSLASGDGAVAVIGSATASVYHTKVVVNSPITIGSSTFRVVGIMKAGGGFGQADDSVIVPRTALRAALGTSGSTLETISALAAPGLDTGAVAASVEAALLSHRHRTEATKDFTITTGQQIMATINTVLGTITIFLGAVAAISLLVGGIGIANTMFMAVFERSRQIGILKALGASNPDVAGLFVAESSILGFIGGVLGLGVGAALAAIVAAIGVQLGPSGGKLELVISTQLAVEAILFALVIGTLSGLLPALRASRLQPVETLRAE
ncbi:MAG: ABC transporter permease [Thermoplasmatota archaeon]